MSAESYQQQLKRVLGELKFHGTIPDWYKEYCAKTDQPVPFADDSRRYPRFRFTTQAVLKCDGNLPTIPRAPDAQLILTIDLSRQGLSFLHSEQLFPLERCTVWLPDHQREYMVRRCRRRHAQCYEVGAQLVVRAEVGVSP